MPPTPRAVRVRTSSGWQDIALQGPPGVPGAIQSIDDTNLPARLRSNTTSAGADLNTCVLDGWYYIDAGLPAANNPTGTFGVLEVVNLAGGTSNVLQKAYNYSVNEIWMRRMFGGTWQPWVKIYPPVDSMATTLPASPANGQTAVLQDAGATYAWQMQWDAPWAVWRYVGGAPAVVGIGTSEVLSTAGAWLDLATAGPKFVVPRTGQYWCSGTALYQPQPATANGNDYYLSIVLNASAVQIYRWQTSIIMSGNPFTDITVPPYAPINLNAGDEVRLRYYQTAAMNTNIQLRYLWVHPNYLS